MADVGAQVAGVQRQQRVLPAVDQVHQVQLQQRVDRVLRTRATAKGFE